MSDLPDLPDYTTNQVDRTELVCGDEPVTVSTVWYLDHDRVSHETAVFGGPADEWSVRTWSRDVALLAHDTAVRALRRGDLHMFGIDR
jgi:hypothetical protein